MGREKEVSVAVRKWMAWRLINVAKVIYPARSKQRVWQIIEVPRRLSETEQAEIERGITNL